jgi:hypothetical protein
MLSLDHQRSHWEAERSWLNHDLLKNRFENKVDAYAVICRDHPVLSLLAPRFEEIRTQWVDLAKGIERLLGRYREEAGPNRFFSQPPLDNLQQDDREWLMGLTRSMWWQRVGGESLLAEARRCLAAVQNRMTSLEAAIAAGEADLNALHKVVTAAVAFSNSVHELGSALSAFKKRSYLDT